MNPEPGTMNPESEISNHEHRRRQNPEPAIMNHPTQDYLSELSPEHRLLLLSARLHMDDETVRTIESILSGGQPTNPEPGILNPESEILNQEYRISNRGTAANPKLKTQNSKPRVIDWEYILSSAKRLGAAPLLWRHLQKEEFSPLVPNHVLQSLRSAYHRQAMKGLRTQAQIQKLNQAATDRGIPVIFLKGAALSRWLYEDMALRPMSDIDILIKNQDIPRTQQMLHDLGYEQKQGARQTPMLEDFAVEWNHLSPFHLKNGQRVEVHTNVFGQYPNGLSQKQRLWQTAETVTKPAGPFLRLSNECFLLHLLLHLYNHMMKGGMSLYWICDIVELLRKTGPNINWQTVCSLGENLEAQNSIARMLATLNACSLLSGLPVMMPKTQDTPLDLNALMTTEKAIQLGRRNLNAANMRFFKKFYQEKGFACTLSVLFRILIPTREHMTTRYPEGCANAFQCYAGHFYNRVNRFLRSVLLRRHSRGFKF